MKISVIIPVFEEEEVIQELVQGCLALSSVSEVIVVDDGSGDLTGKKASDAGARVITHPYNMGNGAAVKTGLREAKGEIVVFMDGDGQHDPSLIPQLLEDINQHYMVVGSRKARDHSSLFRFSANSIYNLLARYVTKFKVQDLTSGFRAIRRKTALKFIYLLPNTFSYPATITLAFLRSGYSVKYISIPVYKRKGSPSKIRIFKDGSRFFIIILKITMLFSPLRIFLPFSIFLLSAGIGNYVYTYLRFHSFTNMSALLMTTSVLVFMLGLIAEQIAMLRMDRSENE